MARTSDPSDPVARAGAHFDRALALGGGLEASPLIALAEAVCVARQDRARFESLLRQALAIDADAHPASRLVNVIMQRRARRLLDHIDDLFLPAAEPEPTPAAKSIIPVP